VTKGTSAVTNGNCYLLEMTAEIRQKIWNYAVKHDTLISPKQVKDRSNKFWPSGLKVAANPSKLTQNGQPLERSITAAQLSLTCHQIYDEVAGTGLFYQINEINFACFDDMLAYLVAITPIRRNAIRAVNIEWSHDRWTMKHALTMLATCEGLRKLEVNVHYSMRWLWAYRHWRNGLHDELTSQLRGLESFKLVETHTPPAKVEIDSALLLSITRTEANIEKAKAELGVRSRAIETIVTGPRRTVPFKKIRAAEEASRLNIFGEGRLGPDKKPGIVASRTRGQLQKQKNLNEFGLLEEAEEHPKFSKFGDLLWDIKAITDSRELASDRGKQRIEVNVTWATKPDQSWEILDRIVNTANVLQVARHYVKNPEAYDIGIAISTIKEFVEKDVVQALALDSLTTMMKKNDNPEASTKARRLSRSRTFR
jgi:hypothetical protein